MRPAPIKDRIIAAIKAEGHCIEYYKLAIAVFPTDQFPRAFRYRNDGGPPGCYMALSRALRVHGFSVHYESTPAPGRDYRTVMMGHALKGGAA